MRSIVTWTTVGSFAAESELRLATASGRSGALTGVGSSSSKLCNATARASTGRAGERTGRSGAVLGGRRLAAAAKRGDRVGSGGSAAASGARCGGSDGAAGSRLGAGRVSCKVWTAWLAGRSGLAAAGVEARAGGAASVTCGAGVALEPGAPVHSSSSSSSRVTRAVAKRAGRAARARGRSRLACGARFSKNGSDTGVASFTPPPRVASTRRAAWD